MQQFGAGEEESMQAAVFYSAADVRVETVPDLKPGPGQVLCRVGAAGICGSDLHGYRAAKAGKPSPGKYPRVAPGHELAGTIVGLGTSVTSLVVGDRVGIEPLCGCGKCEWCAIGQYHLCPKLEHIGGARSGGFAELTVAPEEKCFRLPDSIGFDEASTLDCAAVAVHALHRVPIKPSDSVAVFGTGAIGLYTAAVARAVGARQVIVVGGHREMPLRVARQMGATDTVNASQVDPAKQIRDLTGGRGADVVFETVGGRADTIDRCLASAARGGSVGIVGSFQDPQTITTRPALFQELSLIWVWSYAKWGTETEYKTSLDMLADGRIKALPLITHRFPLAEIATAFEAADNKQDSDSIKVCVIPGAD